jgi:hypothetical protein
VAVKYQQEFLSSVKGQVASLLEEDYSEIEHDKDRRKLKPNWNLYERLEGLGLLYIFTARSEGVLVGYFTVLVHEDLHDSDNVCATQDVLFLSKPYRKGLSGLKLVRFGERCLKQDGYSHLTITTTMKNPVYSLMKRLGYTKVEEKFERKL